MADQKITQLNEATALENTDLLEIVQDVESTPVNKKVSIETLKSGLSYVTFQCANFVDTPAAESVFGFGLPLFEAQSDFDLFYFKNPLEKLIVREIHYSFIRTGAAPGSQSTGDQLRFRRKRGAGVSTTLIIEGMSFDSFPEYDFIKSDLSIELLEDDQFCLEWLSGDYATPPGKITGRAEIFCTLA